MAHLPTVGEQLQGYQILGRIGAGGMGVVFHARDLKLDRLVALKFLPEHLYDNEADKRKLLQEARVISALDHPNICTIFDLEETADGLIFIVMAYYDGGTLADRLAHGPLPLPETLELLAAIASGLGAAHAHQIVHRDIKPSNILLTKQNAVKIADFGLARIVSNANETQSVDTSGTVSYMSPEQLRGESVDHRVDIWAVGVLAAEMASGRHPFHKDNLAAIAYSICHESPQVAEATPDGIRHIIYKCLSKDPALRYENCEALLRELRALQSGQAVASQSSARNGADRRTNAAAARQTDGRTGLTGEPDRRMLDRRMRAASGSSPVRAVRKRWALPAAAAVIALAAVAIPTVREHLLGALFTPTEKHIAVLPFDNIGNDPANEAVAGGLMDSMTGEISNLDADQKSLWVVPASVVRSEKVTDPSAALKLLGATLVVEGSIQRVGKSVTVTLNLINTKTLRQIAAVTASNEEGDVAAVQRQVLIQLGRLLNVTVSHSDLARAGGSSTPAAYDLYLEALGYMQRFDKAASLDLAVARLQSALAQDPNFALAYATLGEAYRLKYKADKDFKWLQPALANCQHAIKLNPQLPSAYVTLGYLHIYTGHYELATAELQRAAALDSRNPDAIDGLAGSYELAGRLPEAEEQFKRAVALRPEDWSGYNELALFYDRNARYSEAITQVKRGIELSPDNAMTFYNLGAFYVDAGNPADYQEAEKALQRSLVLQRSYPAYANLGLLYLQEKRYAESAAMTEKALALNDRDLQPWSYAEHAYRWLNQTTKADAAVSRIRELAEAGVKANPQNGERQSWLGWAYAKQGLRQKAVPHLESAMALSPTEHQVLINLIEAYDTLGDEATVRRLMQQAKLSNISLADLNLDPDTQRLLSTHPQ